MRQTRALTLVKVALATRRTWLHRLARTLLASLAPRRLVTRDGKRARIAEQIRNILSGQRLVGERDARDANTLGTVPCARSR